MTDQLTSVRLGTDTLESLRLFAAAHGTTLAAEIRIALDEYIEKLKGSPELKEQLRKHVEDREKLIERLLVAANPSK